MIYPWCRRIMRDVRLALGCQAGEVLQGMTQLLTHSNLLPSSPHAPFSSSSSFPFFCYSSLTTSSSLPLIYFSLTCFFSFPLLHLRHFPLPLLLLSRLLHLSPRSFLIPFPFWYSSFNVFPFFIPHLSPFPPFSLFLRLLSSSLPFISIPSPPLPSSFFSCLSLFPTPSLQPPFSFHIFLLLFSVYLFPSSVHPLFPPFPFSLLSPVLTSSHFLLFLNFFLLLMLLSSHLPPPLRLLPLLVCHVTEVH